MSRFRTALPTSVLCLLFLLSLFVLAPAQDQPMQGPGKLLTLQEAVRMALARGPEIYQAQAEAARAAAALKEIRSLNLPQVTTGTGLAYNNGYPLSIEGAAPSIVQVGVNQSIFSKKNKSLILEAESGSLASRAGAEGTRNALAARTILLYSELHQARLMVPILEKQRGTAATNLQIIETLLESGKALSVDRTQARVAEANIAQQVLVARERVRLAETGLRALTGLSEGQPILTESPKLRTELLSLPAEQLYQKALEANPEIREAQANLRAKEFHIQSEQAERYPQFALIGEYALFSKANNYQDYFNRFTRNNYLVGISIQYPIFNGYRTDARIAQSRQDAESARLRLQRLQSDLKVNLERGASDLRIARGAVGLAQLEVTASEEKMQLSETLKEAGRIEPKDLESARNQLLEKRAAAIEAERALFERQVVLLQASGTLSSLF
jgi:outer membrane protein